MNYEPLNRYFKGIPLMITFFLVLATFPFGFLSYFSNNIKNLVEDESIFLLLGWLVGTIAWSNGIFNYLLPAIF